MGHSCDRRTCEFKAGRRRGRDGTNRTFRRHDQLSLLVAVAAQTSSSPRAFLGRFVSQPTMKAQARLKNVARCVENPSGEYDRKGRVSDAAQLVAWKDSDLAREQVTRRNTIGGMRVFAGCATNPWLTRQSSNRGEGREGAPEWLHLQIDTQCANEDRWKQVTKRRAHCRPTRGRFHPGRARTSPDGGACLGGSSGTWCRHEHWRR